MAGMTRREMFAGLPAIAFGSVLEAQTAPAEGAVLGETRVYPVDAMAVRKMTNGGESRDVLRGVLTTGEAIAVHESEQPAAMKPNPLHTIQHSEVIVVIEGTVGVEHDGKVEKVGPGGVIFVAPGTQHAVRNAGEGTAKYCVVQVGGDVKK
jgi:mannose-6-phosphate isomerase-like protein (cupin superfamily)